MRRIKMKRIILHWTAGGRTASDLDCEHYHFLINQNGEMIRGLYPVSANEIPLSRSYAAHTRGFNSESIGVALCGMVGAIERPFGVGSAPLTVQQVQGAYGHIADLMREHGLVVSRDTLFTHAEAEPLHGVAQSGKWDISWLPGMSAPGDPIEVGDVIRANVAARMGPSIVADPNSKDDLKSLWKRQQQLLLDFGKNPGPVDGLPGPRTMGALRALLMDPPR